MSLILYSPYMQVFPVHFKLAVTTDLSHCTASAHAIFSYKYLMGIFRNIVVIRVVTCQGAWNFWKCYLILIGILFDILDELICSGHKRFAMTQNGSLRSQMGLYDPSFFLNCYTIIIHRDT